MNIVLPSLAILTTRNLSITYQIYCKFFLHEFHVKFVMNLLLYDIFLANLNF